VANGTVLVGHPLDETVFDEPMEAIGEQVPGDAEVALELAEPMHPSEEVSEDAQRPTVAHHVEGGGDGARRFGGAHGCGTVVGVGLDLQLTRDHPPPGPGSAISIGASRSLQVASTLTSGTASGTGSPALRAS
jgi:hypothetical protein